MPHIIHLVREPSNKHIFSNMTSGFTSVTNSFLIGIIKKTIDFIQRDRVRMIHYPDFFSNGYKSTITISNCGMSNSCIWATSLSLSCLFKMPPKTLKIAEKFKNKSRLNAAQKPFQAFVIQDKIIHMSSLLCTARVQCHSKERA